MQSPIPSASSIHPPLHPPQKNQREEGCCCRPQFFRASSLSHLLPLTFGDYRGCANNPKKLTQPPSKITDAHPSRPSPFPRWLEFKRRRRRRARMLRLLVMRGFFALALAKLLGGCDDASFLPPHFGYPSNMQIIRKMPCHLFSKVSYCGGTFDF